MKSFHLGQLVLLAVVLGCKLKSIHGGTKVVDESARHDDAKKYNLMLSQVIEQNLFDGQKRYQHHKMHTPALHIRPVHIEAVIPHHKHSSRNGNREEDIKAMTGYLQRNIRAGQLRYNELREKNQIDNKKRKKHISNNDRKLQNIIERNLMGGELRYNEIQARRDDQESSGNPAMIRKRRQPPPTSLTVSSSLLSPTIATKLPKPIMAVGFPKAGTSSIFSFFHCAGLRSMHWYCCGEQTHPQLGGPQHMSDCMLRNLAQDFPILYRCGNYDVFAEMNGPRKTIYNETTQQTGVLLDDGTYDFDGPTNRIMLPQHHYLQEIHEEYPHATFILNLRPVNDWVDSVMRWKNDLAMQIVNEYNAQSNGEIGSIPTNSQEMKTLLSKIYESHTSRIREFVAMHPTHALVEVDISDIKAGNVLADAFGLDASCWSHENHNVEVTDI